MDSNEQKNTTYVSKRLRVDAIQWTGDNPDEVEAFFRDRNARGTCHLRHGLMRLQTEFLDTIVEPTDWIIINQNNVSFMANDEAFKRNYEPIDEVLDPNGGSQENPMGD